MKCLECGNYLGKIELEEPVMCRSEGKSFWGHIFSRQCSNCYSHMEVTIKVESLKWPLVLIEL